MAKRNTYFQDEVMDTSRVDFKQMKRLLKYVVPRKRLFFLTLTLTILSSLTALVSPVLLETIVDKIIPNSDYTSYIVISILMIAVGIVDAVIPYFVRMGMGELGHGIIHEIRQEIFFRLQQLPFEYYDNRPAGKISVRVTEYINEIAEFFTAYLMNFILNVLKILVVTIIMLVMNPLLTAVVYACVIPMLALIFVIRKSLRFLFRYHRAKNSNRVAFIVESIMGEKVIKSFNRDDYNLSIYDELQNDSASTWMKIVRRNELSTPVTEFFWNLATILVYFIAVILMSNGGVAVTAGGVITFTALMAQCTQPFNTFSMIIQNLAQISANLERVFETIDTPVTICDNENAVELKDVSGRIEFDDVTFGYDEGINVLEHLSLKVNSGETIALVGPTGAGKTTIINFITRFYDVNKGAVKVDGIDVRNIKLKSLRNQIGILMQDPFIFKGSVMENIRYGKPDATDEECVAAAEKIGANVCIERLPDKYQTMLEERGEGLSSGEKQLISFARIILKDPAVVILDEATSSVDSETEKIIQSALDVVLAKKTSFVVAHRLSTIRKADRILFIADKGIAEEGSHEQLMNKKGLYYALNTKII